MTEIYRPLEFFISHSSIQKTTANSFKNQLEFYGCNAFVAHDDIKPSIPWLAEIKKALSTADILIGLSSKEFNNSVWCQQEVGWALGRGIPTHFVLVGEASPPNGFVNERQAFRLSSYTDDLAVMKCTNQIIDVLGGDPNLTGLLRKGIIRKLFRSGSFESSKTLSRRLTGFTEFDEEDIEMVTEALKENHQVKNSFGVPNLLRELLGIQTHSSHRLALK